MRDDGSPGNRQLIADGGMPLPVDRPVEELAVEGLATRHRLSLLETAGTALGPAGAGHNGSEVEVSDQPSSSDDAFLAVWPILARHLREPLRERDVAERMGLELTQARVWLKRAVDEGHVDVTRRPKRYVLRSSAAEQLRIDHT